jgi:hypothetical protein
LNLPSSWNFKTGLLGAAVPDASAAKPVEENRRTAQALTAKNALQSLFKEFKRIPPDDSYNTKISLVTTEIANVQTEMIPRRTYT